MLLNRVHLVVLFIIFTLTYSFTSLIAKSPSQPNPLVSGFMGSVIPGAGYFNNGNTTAGFLGVSLLIPMASAYHVTAPTAEASTAKRNVYITARNLFGYTVFDSYQDALDMNNRPKKMVNIPHYSFSDLYLAPLKSRNYQTWKVGVPLGLVGFIVGARIAREGISPKVTIGRAAIAIPLIVLQAFLIGAGEEAEFRGFYYPAMSEITGSRFLGNVAQATYFGCGHTSWGVCVSPNLSGILLRETSTVDLNREYGQSPVSEARSSFSHTEEDLLKFALISLMGFYDGYIVSSEQDGLLKAIAYHAIWDSALLISDFLTTGNTVLYLSMGFRL